MSVAFLPFLQCDHGVKALDFCPWCAQLAKSYSEPEDPWSSEPSDPGWTLRPMITRGAL